MNGQNDDRSFVAGDDNSSVVGGGGGGGVFSSAAPTNNWTLTHISITFFMSLGILTNGSAIVFLFRRGAKSMFHRLLKILAISDLIVDTSCGILWGIPQSSGYYSRQIFPRLGPYLIPISQMAVMMSIFSTAIMGLERYVRFNFICQFRYRSWITPRNFTYYVAFIVLFPVVFYLPKFFELTYIRREFDCGAVLRNVQLLRTLIANLRDRKTLAAANNLTGPAFPTDPDALLLQGQGTEGRPPGHPLDGGPEMSPSPDFATAISSDVMSMLYLCFDASKADNYGEAIRTSPPDSVLTYYSIRATSLRKNPYYYHGYFVGANTLFAYCIPFVFLVVLNVLIVRVLNAPPSPADLMVANSVAVIRAATAAARIGTGSIISADQQLQPGRQPDRRCRHRGQGRRCHHRHPSQGRHTLTQSISSTSSSSDLSDRIPPAVGDECNSGGSSLKMNRFLPTCCTSRRADRATINREDHLPDGRRPTPLMVRLLPPETSGQAKKPRLEDMVAKNNGLVDDHRRRRRRRPALTGWAAVCRFTTTSAAPSQQSSSQSLSVNSIANLDHQRKPAPAAILRSILRRECPAALGPSVFGIASEDIPFIDVDLDLGTTTTTIPGPTTTTTRGSPPAGRASPEEDRRHCSRRISIKMLAEQDGWGRSDSQKSLTFFQQGRRSLNANSIRIMRFFSQHHRKQEARLTRISLSIICLYLVCHIWKLIPTFYEAIYGNEKSVLPVWPAWLTVISDLSHVLIVFNSAVNFLLYLVL